MSEKCEKKNIQVQSVSNAMICANETNDQIFVQHAKNQFIIARFDESCTLFFNTLISTCGFKLVVRSSQCVQLSGARHGFKFSTVLNLSAFNLPFC